MLTSKTVQQAAEKQDIFIKNINDSGGQVIQFRKYFPMHKLCNISKLQFKANVEDYSSTFGANPVKSPTRS